MVFIVLFIFLIIYISGYHPLCYLYICLFIGQDIATCGFTGAMFGGLFCAGAILNRSLHTDLANLTTEIRKEQQTKKQD